VPNNAFQPLLIHDTAQPLVPYSLHITQHFYVMYFYDYYRFELLA